MHYTAIDFETANRSQESGCSVGLVKFDEEGEVLDTYYSLIKPRSLYFDPFCFSIHHLDPIDILRAPGFDEIWKDVSSFIGEDVLVAHNAQFDAKVLRKSLAVCGIEAPSYDYYCTLSLSRKLWPGRESYKLTKLAEGFSWTYEAHNALEDAIICGKLFSRLMGENLFEKEVFEKYMKRLYKKDRVKFPQKV